MTSFINRNPDNWYSAKWPFASAKQVRDNSTMQDAVGRSYCQVSDADRRHMQLSRLQTWWWVALTSTNQPILEMGSRVHMLDAPCVTVRDIGLDFYPRRLVAVVSFSKKRS